MPAYQRWFLCLLILLFGYAFLPDDTEIKTIVARLEAFRKKYPQEKVHLHFDKPYYSIGDTLYFKAYVVNAEKNRPSAISNVLYVDIINETNNVLQTQRFPLTDGIARGSIPLADSMGEGDYRIRAYTAWMRNENEAFFFHATIPVRNGFNSDLLLSASFTNSNTDDKEEDFLIVHYQSLRNAVVKGKEVSYAFIINKKETARGKALIDGNGNIKVPLPKLTAQGADMVSLITRIPDGTATVTKEINISLPSAKHSIRFFPEGGQLVADLPARIGFKAVGSNGLGTDISGTVSDDSTGETISFRSDFKGIGSFRFTPQAAHSYHADIVYANGRKEKLSLLLVQPYGYSLAIDNSKEDKIDIHMAAKEATPVDKVILVAQCNNRIQYAAPLFLNDGKTDISLSKKKFQTGIVQFTLFDTALQPVAERLAFINHHDELHIEASFDTKNISKRQKVRMTLQVKDGDGNPVAGSFSLAATDARTVLKDKTNNTTILSNLLLTSDLRGVIESPDDYFINPDDAKAEALDNLLLTQGWRRFVWQDVLQNKPLLTPFEAEKSLAVSGKVLSAKGTPAAGSKVTLLSKGGTAFILDTTTDANGNFMFDELSFDESHPFVVQAVGPKGEKNVKVKLNDFFTPPVAVDSSYAYRENTTPEVMMPYLTRSLQQFDVKRKNGLLQDNTHLKEVVVTTALQSRVQEAVAPSANLNGPGRADQILTYADLQDCHDLSVCLQGKLLGVYFKNVADDPTARVKTYRIKPFSTAGNGAPMAVILDGMDLTGPGSVDMRTIPVQNIQSIEVLRSAAYAGIYGLHGAGGVLVITTKRCNIDYNATLPQNKKVVEDVVFTTARGYAASREFYMPDYSNTAALRNPVPDLRTTIFWKSDIVTNDEGKAIVEWYNGDNEGDCNITIEGFSGDGKLGHAEFKFSVQP